MSAGAGLLADAELANNLALLEGHADDERMPIPVANLRKWFATIDALRHVLRNQIHRDCTALPPAECIYRPGGTNGWVACCAARKAGVR